VTLTRRAMRRATASITADAGRGEGGQRDGAVVAKEPVEDGTRQCAHRRRAASQGARSAISGSMRADMDMDMGAEQHVERNGDMTRAAGMGNPAEGC
jgi:hypothetical protein